MSKHTIKNVQRSKAGIFFWISVGSILYTYIGYPLLISLLARLRPKQEKYYSHIPTVTLLIAAYNEEDVVDEKILNSLSLDYPKERIQILVVADGSNDRTPEIVNKHSNSGVELLFQPERRGKMAAINRAIAYARGDIIVFSDANNFYMPDTIKELVAPFSNPQVGAVSGAKTVQGASNVGASEGLYWKYESYIKEQESKFNSCTSVVGEVWAVRKAAYQAPPNNIINDDFYLAMLVLKQGYRLVYAPTALSVERVSSSAEGEIVRRKRIIAGRYQAISNSLDILPFNKPVLIWQVVSHKFMRPLVPFFMIGALAANIMALFHSKETNYKRNLRDLKWPYNIVFLSIQSLFYGLAWIGNQQEQTPQTPNAKKLKRILYLPTFLVNSNLAALQGFIHYINGKQSHIWERVSRE